MCRLAALPPGMTAEEAMEIVKPFGMGNKDGTGVAYSDGGRLVIRKWPLSLEEVVKGGHPLFAHMPSKSWTIFHVRLATHGKVERRNTHPFVHDNMAFCHNGIYGPHKAIKEALGNKLALTSDTDSDVGAGFLRLVGPERFVQANSGISGGVFLGLTPTGGLWASVLSGDLEYAKYNDTYVLASSLPSKYKTATVGSGFLIFESDGSYRRGEFYENSYNNYHCYNYNTQKMEKTEKKVINDINDGFKKKGSEDHKYDWNNWERDEIRNGNFVWPDGD